MSGTKIVRTVGGVAVVTDTRPLAQAKAERAAEIEVAVQAQIDAAHAALGWDREGGTLRALRLLKAKSAGPLSADMLALEVAIQSLDDAIDAAQMARAVAMAAIEAATTNAAVDAVTL